MQRDSPGQMTPKRRLKVALIGAVLAAIGGSLHGLITSEAALGGAGSKRDVAAKFVRPDAYGRDPLAGP